MECLRGYIGIIGCGNDSPASGLLINSLPGLPVIAIDKLANEEQVTYKNVWEDVQTRAINKFATDVISAFAKRYAVKTIQRSVNIGRKIKVTETVASSDSYRGIAVEVDLKDSIYQSSSLQQISVQSFAVYLLTLPDAPVPVKIFDLETEEELFSSTINQQGWNVVAVNKKFDARRIFICYNATDDDSVTLDLPAGISDSFNACVCKIYCDDCCGYVRGAMSSGVATPTDLSYSNNLFGVSAIFSIVCNFDNLICNNKEAFKNSLWYCLGAELMVERIFTSRLSYWKINKDEAEELMALFNLRYQEQLQQAVDGINLDMNDCCIECNEQVTVKEVHP